ncbi:hypothetical protein ACGFT2_14750 [Streptomyces sp. NPDC048514]|uniref:hypothetical protein n=1 Tax=Streptomyces sp. NPDC048514 TaxID=3365564 RepID=UPI0037109D24
MKHWVRRPLPQHEEINVVFFRGVSTDALTRGLLAERRLPLAYGKSEDWSVIMHDMLSWESEDYDLVSYGRLCRGGGELAVFVTEPCKAKAHAPAFEYYRDGRLITHLSFEDLSRPGGENPHTLVQALTAAKVIGPEAAIGDDDDERLVQAIAEFFQLPELAMS